MLSGICEECGQYADLYRDRATGLYICDDCANGEEPSEENEDEEE